jgi:hypothetical protein
MSPAEAMTRLRFSRASCEGGVAGELWARVVDEEETRTQRELENRRKSIHSVRTALIPASDRWFKQLIEYPHSVATCRAARVKLLPRRLRFRSCE